jgi:cytochrome c5
VIRTGLRSIPITGCLLLAACGPEPTTAPDAQAMERAANLTPADSRLSALYVQSCRACHSTAAAGAPLTGDRASWDSRWSKGMATLRSSTINGLNGMPAGGQCFACSAQDYEALITFMAGREAAAL